MLIDVVGKKKGKGRKFRKRIKRIKVESEKMSVTGREHSLIYCVPTVYSHVSAAADTERVNRYNTQDCAWCYGQHEINPCFQGTHSMLAERDT